MPTFVLTRNKDGTTRDAQKCKLCQPQKCMMAPFEINFNSLFILMGNSEGTGFIYEAQWKVTVIKTHEMLRLKPCLLPFCRAAVPFSSVACPACLSSSLFLRADVSHGSCVLLVSSLVVAVGLLYLI